MTVNFALPSNELAPYIKRYWAMENSLDKGEKCVERIVPTGLPELSFYFSKRPKVLNNNRYILDNVTLNGLQNDFYDLELTGDLSIFVIVFQPHGLTRFLKFPLFEISNRNIPLKHLIGQKGQDLEEKMAEAVTFHQRVNIVETYLLSLLNRDNDDFKFRRINHISKLIRQTHGIIGINQMASEACLCRRQFERIFAEQIGISPKQYLKIIRFQYALFQKQQDADLDMIDLAYKCGYYDQSHFINDFKSLSGLTPNQCFAENEVCSDFFSLEK